METIFGIVIKVTQRYNKSSNIKGFHMGFTFVCINMTEDCSPQPVNDGPSAPPGPNTCFLCAPFILQYMELLLEK